MRSSLEPVQSFKTAWSQISTNARTHARYVHARTHMRAHRRTRARTKLSVHRQKSWDFDRSGPGCTHYKINFLLLAARVYYVHSSDCHSCCTCPVRVQQYYSLSLLASLPACLTDWGGCVGRGSLTQYKHMLAYVCCRPLLSHTHTHVYIHTLARKTLVTLPLLQRKDSQ